MSAKRYYIVGKSFDLQLFTSTRKYDMNDKPLHGHFWDKQQSNKQKDFTCFADTAITLAASRNSIFNSLIDIES